MNAKVRISKRVFMDATWIIPTIILIDMAMTNLDHYVDLHARVPHNEAIIVSHVAAKYFTSNHCITLAVMQPL